MIKRRNNNVYELMIRASSIKFSGAHLLEIILKTCSDLQEQRVDTSVELDVADSANFQEFVFSEEQAILHWLFKCSSDNWPLYCP